MQGPSLDAIRRVKEQLERKKQDEEELKAKNKLSILEHRAAQGDRRAKKELKELEKIKETRSKSTQEQQKQKNITSNNAHRNNISKKSIPNAGGRIVNRSTKAAVMDFDELMKLAEQNKNLKPTAPPLEQQPKRKQIVKPTTKLIPPVVQAPVVAVSKKPTQPAKFSAQPPVRSQVQSQSLTKLPISQAITKKPLERKPPPTMNRQKSQKFELEESAEVRAQLMRLKQMRAQQQRMNNQIQPLRHTSYAAHHVDEGDYEDYSDYEDRYEQDDFVVDDDEDDVQNEISRTIRSVFKYDKSRCDAREREVELEYQRIGNVSTFEDLEREERRAARLGAAEDAQAEREEEERKRRKKQRRLEKNRR